MREAAVDAVEFEEMRIGLDRAEIVDPDDFDIAPLVFCGGTQDQPANTAEPVDRDSNRHLVLLNR
jgi:hypothetical protein